MSPGGRARSPRPAAWARLALLVLTALIPLGAQAAVRAELDRDVVGIGEAFELRITATGQGARAPDLEVLDADFQVLGIGRNSRISVVDGEVAASSGWTVTLTARREGALTIPPIPVAGGHTPALAVEVLEDPGSGDGGEVILESEVDTAAPYVQAQVLYTVRLYHRRLAGGRLADPEVPGALVRRLGEDRAFVAEREGTRYRVIERRYAIFPQRPGPLTIPAPVLTARLAQAGGGPRTPFGRLDALLAPTRTVRREGEPLSLEVRPRPAAAPPGDWLPAREVTINETWSPAPEDLVAGQPLTRTVTIAARGLEAAQLPDIPEPRADGLRVYPEAPRRDDDHRITGVRARREDTQVLVPSGPGTLELPPVVVHWWDVAADAPREAVLPARVLRVAAAPGQAADTAAMAPLPGADARAAGSPGREAGPWPWIAGLALIGWLATALAWAWVSRQRAAGGEPRPGSGPRPTRAPVGMRLLEGQFLAGDAPGARDALLHWGARRWPLAPPRSLHALAGRLESGYPEAAAALRELDRVLYSPRSESWDGPAAWAILRPALRPAVRREPPPPPARRRALLPPLNVGEER